MSYLLILFLTLATLILPNQTSLNAILTAPDRLLHPAKTAVGLAYFFAVAEK